ncbi:MAG: acyloxyacyl hydrolase [Chitinophagaceae bacterium]|nr:acyloxyacyl hydrolase [Chitinophagaceae bacterium]MBL0131685.1 acyloxyacyl hydrolase [Chitinophagaceae bacterium]
MRDKNFRKSWIATIIFLTSYMAAAQPGEKRIQYPWGLKNAYFGINMGTINYPFSSAQLEPGFNVESVTIPHLAPRLILYGQQFSKYLSLQISYMRPVKWVSYNNINGDGVSHSVWMNVAGLTLATQLPVHKKFSLFAEGGLGIITRKGFEINNSPVVKNASFATFLFGGAFQYHLNPKWDLQISTTWSPAHAKAKQPHTIFYSAGFNYHLKELPKEKIESKIKSGYSFARHFLQVSYTTNAMGYGVNNLFSKKLVLFWGGAAHVKQGFSLNYQRNIFHARKVFSFDWYAGMGFWKSRNNQDNFYSLSLNPVLRFTAVRSKKTDLFFEYSVAGPTYLSKKIIDNERTGKHFTFHDFMGIGIFTGQKKNLNAGIRIAHFSNGNIFPQNDGVKVPLTFSLGYVLK